MFQNWMDWKVNQSWKFSVFHMTFLSCQKSTLTSFYCNWTPLITPIPKSHHQQKASRLCLLCFTRHNLALTASAHNHDLFPINFPSGSESFYISWEVKEGANRKSSRKGWHWVYLEYWCTGDSKMFFIGC